MTTGGTGEKGGRVRDDSLPGVKIRKPGWTAGLFIHCKELSRRKITFWWEKIMGFVSDLLSLMWVGTPKGRSLVTYLRHKLFLNFLNLK